MCLDGMEIGSGLLGKGVSPVRGWKVDGRLHEGVNVKRKVEEDLFESRRGQFE